MGSDQRGLVSGLRKGKGAPDQLLDPVRFDEGKQIYVSGVAADTGPMNGRIFTAQSQSGVQPIRPTIQLHEVVKRAKLEADSTRSGERESMISLILPRCSIPHAQSGINAIPSVMPNGVMV